MMNDVMNYIAPENIHRSKDFELTVNGESLFCYTVRVYDQRFAKGKLKGLDYSYASFAYVDVDNEAVIAIKCNGKIINSIVRPISYGIEANVEGNHMSFDVAAGQKITVEPYGEHGPALHIFINEIEIERPDISDENVIYFGPGVHEVSEIVLESNQTLYLAGGAIIRGIIKDEEKCFREEPRAEILYRYQHLIRAENAENITIRGRGIIDTSDLCDQGIRKNPIHFTNCSNVKVEGIIINEATCWHLTLYRCQNCLVENVKEISWFYNTDGINLVSSQNVQVKNCFMRQRDDGVVMKAMDTGNMDCFIEEPLNELPGGETCNVEVSGCVIWSDWGYALGATYETRKPIYDISFRDCDIVHATHETTDQGVIGVLISDENDVSDMSFEGIRIERSLKPIIKLEIKRTKWTVSEKLGNIRKIAFKDIVSYDSSKALTLFSPYSDDTKISDITLEKVRYL